MSDAGAVEGGDGLGEALHPEVQDVVVAQAHHPHPRARERPCRVRMPAIPVALAPGIQLGGRASPVRGRDTGLPAVDASTCLDPPACGPQVSRGTVTSGGGTLTLNPGIYTTINATGSGPVVLNPGIYVIKGGLNSNTNSNITGTGVMLYLACSSWPSPCAPGQAGAGMDFQGAGGIGTQAPTSGPYQGIAIFADRNNASTIGLQSQGTVVVKGTIYGASALLTYTSNGSTTPLNSALVVGKLTVQATQDLTMSYDPGVNSPRFTFARNRGITR